MYRYVTKNTFDAYLWGIVETKQRFISQVMTSRELARDCEDVDETVLNFAEIKAVASGNPLIMEKMEVDNEVTRLRVLKSAYEGKRYLLQDAFTLEYPNRIKDSLRRLEGYETDIQKRKEEIDKKPMFEIMIKRKTFTKHKEAGEFLSAVIAQATPGEEVQIGMYKGFELSIKKFLGEDLLYIHGSYEKYKMELKSSETGNMVRLENLINGLDSEAEKVRQRIQTYKVEMENAKTEYEKPFAYEELLREKLKRQMEINTLLEIKEPEEMDIDVPEENIAMPVAAAAAR